MNDINEYFEEMINRGKAVWRYGSFWYPRVVCADGFNMSVQAGHGLYSAPIAKVCPPFVTVEVGFPSKWVPSFAEHDDGTGDVFGHVPVEVVNEVIAAHGGIVVE